MNINNDISAELNSMGSSLADMSRKMPYSVPADYFENLTGNLQGAIKSQDEKDPVPAWIKGTLPYTVPESYFDQLAANITAAASADGLLSDTSREVPFTVPTGYFEALPAKILAAAKADDQVVKETTVKRTIEFRPGRWAAAAVLLICISAGSYITFFSPGRPNPEKILASVPNNDIQDYLQIAYRPDADQVVSNTEISKIQLDNKDIIEYLNETGWDAVD